MDLRAKIDRIYFKLSVESKDIFSLMLARNGALNRLGSEDEEGSTAFFMGRTDEPLFDQLLASLSDDMLELTGRYEYPDLRGERCVLTITLEGQDLETGFEFTYGSEAVGPPEEIVDWVDRAITLTDPWYEAQLVRRR
ncbi:MAG: hypothetical protein OHK0039_45250 [Bacteroidia bacterium]